jgi:cyclic beta-1,2-glucan synthetase
MSPCARSAILQMLHRSICLANFIRTQRIESLWQLPEGSGPRSLLTTAESNPILTSKPFGKLLFAICHSSATAEEMRIFDSPNVSAPEVQLFSNGRYHLVISCAGGGYSRWRDLAVTRWREDATRDGWGSFVYVRDVASGEFWSAAYQPALRSPQDYQAIFTEAKAEFRQQQSDIEIQTEICVSPEDDVEVRRVTLTNHSREQRSVELTSYAEIVLAIPWADLAHPVFSNLFVQTEFLRIDQAILCTRRPRSETEERPWLFHLMVGEGGEITCETDRARFIGRNRSVINPAAMQDFSPLSNTVGSVLDPIVSLRRILTLAPGGTARIDFLLGTTESRDAAIALIGKYRNAGMVERSFDLARTASEAAQRRLAVTDSEIEVYGKLGSALIYADPARRASSSVLLQNRLGQSDLWRHGISGDIPIVLLRIGDSRRTEIVKQLVQAHSYWRMKALAVDLVILIEDVSDSDQSLRDHISRLIALGNEPAMLDKRAGVFVRHVDQISSDAQVLLQSVARAVLTAEGGTLAEQLVRLENSGTPVNALTPTQAPLRETPPSLAPRELLFHNGLGGFTPDGREYVVTLGPERATPAPWVNVIANPYFGTVVSESGGAYTWAQNSHEFRLTPWNNDPVTDATGEALYIRDEQSGDFWSPTPSPVHRASAYVIRHGFGYSVFEHTESGIVSELTVYVASDAPVKFAALKLRNISGRGRRISVTGYWEWVLSDLRQNSLLHVQTELDSSSGALLARNFYNSDFSEWIAFVDVDDPVRTVTGDRKEFLGRNGSVSRPAALKREHLSGTLGAGLDPCAAMQVIIDLGDGQERETCFRLGVGRGAAEVQNLVRRFRGEQARRTALEGACQYWKQTLGTIQVETPDASVNLIANGWLFYQTLSCRLWGRTGFYQSGGAFGFRDQLQDVMALVHAEPALVREHLLRAAAHQFREGDVLHWWHPPAERGARTHTSDDYLWLPYVACRYVSCTGDATVLDEKISFLEGRLLKPDEESYYDLPKRSEESDTLYEHCVRSIEHGLRFGEHGLPLIGSCDWNDGMNLVGKEGKGESVWLAFFLHDVLTRFAKLARGRNDISFADRCLAQAQQLQTNVEQHAWDGQWYRRAYFDNGEPLGSRTNPECQIDSLPQSWSVISGAGNPHRARQAMEAVDERLVRRESKLIQLFDPPFDRSDLHPGYIKGYVPGVRENGGQYTHAAIWTVMAFALLGDRDRAWELVALLNPINHSATPGQIDTYKVEPYVIAADVYAVEPHTGRGGWTWYTGSAGWMYRLLTETLLGLDREGDRLRVTPRLPENWTTGKVHYRYRQTQYHITISRLPEDSPLRSRTSLDGNEIADDWIPLVDDRRDHAVQVKVGRSPSEKDR